MIKNFLLWTKKNQFNMLMIGILVSMVLVSIVAAEGLAELLIFFYG